MGGATGALYTKSFYGKYKEIDTGIKSLCSALSFLEAKQKELDNQSESNKTEINLIESERVSKNCCIVL